MIGSTVLPQRYDEKFAPGISSTRVLSPSRVSAATYYAKLGDRARAVALINALPKDLADPHVLLFAAFVFVDLGDKTIALDWLDRAASRGLARNELTEWIDLDPLRSDPRFAALPAR